MPLSEAPERIWLTHEHDASRLYRVFRASSLDHNNDDGSPSDYPEYTRADIADAEIARLRARVAELEEALRQLKHAVCGETGFAACVRQDSGRAYPWPALDAAEEAACRALGEKQ
jgi:hypothetical protein